LLSSLFPFSGGNRSKAVGSISRQKDPVDLLYNFMVLTLSRFAEKEKKAADLFKGFYDTLKQIVNGFRDIQEGSKKIFDSRLGVDAFLRGSQAVKSESSPCADDIEDGPEKDRKRRRTEKQVPESEDMDTEKPNREVCNLKGDFFSQKDQKDKALDLTTKLLAVCKERFPQCLAHLKEVEKIISGQTE